MPVTATELVPPVDCPAVRPSFDGFSLARRLDSGDDRNYSKRPRVARGRDDDNRGRMTSKRERDSVASSRPRDRSVSRKSVGSIETSSDALDWIKLDHEKLTKRAQALAKTRNQLQSQGQNQDSGQNGAGSVICKSENHTSAGEIQVQTVSNDSGPKKLESLPVKNDIPDFKAPEIIDTVSNSCPNNISPPDFSPITSRSNQVGSIQLTPSTLNLSSISLNNTVSSEAMETDEVENELLGINNSPTNGGGNN